MRRIKIVSLLVAITILFASCIYNHKYITDYSEQTRIAKEYFPEIYNLYRQGDVIIESIYLDLDTGKYHISYRYRNN
jgi:hypothetical protein